MIEKNNKNANFDKIPVVVGVTGHRNIVEEDKPKIKEQVIESLKEIQKLCRAKKKGEEDTPVIMLNALAQGADMLCAEAAFELGIKVYAVLPCEKEKYKLSFDLHQNSLRKSSKRHWLRTRRIKPSLMSTCLKPSVGLSRRILKRIG